MINDALRRAIGHTLEAAHLTPSSARFDDFRAANTPAGLCLGASRP